ncbi:hypothetical protein MRX96_030958 [Rhipicephalus microplus]
MCTIGSGVQPIAKATTASFGIRGKRKSIDLAALRWGCFKVCAEVFQEVRTVPGDARSSRGRLFSRVCNFQVDQRGRREGANDGNCALGSVALLRKGSGGALPPARRHLSPSAQGAPCAVGLVINRSPTTVGAASSRPDICLRYERPVTFATFQKSRIELSQRGKGSRSRSYAPK